MHNYQTGENNSQVGELFTGKHNPVYIDLLAGVKDDALVLVSLESLSIQFSITKKKYNKWNF